MASSGEKCLAGNVEEGELDIDMPDDSGLGRFYSYQDDMEVDQLCEHIEEMKLTQREIKADVERSDLESSADLLFIEEEYKEEIYSYLWDRERKYMLPSNFLSHQKEVSPHTRAVVIDWLAEVCKSYQ